MALTYRSLVDTLGTLAITNVTERTEPPQQINPGDLPMGYPRLPSGNSASIGISRGPEVADMQCEYVVLLESVPLNTLAYNYDLTVDMMDSLHDALNVKVDSGSDIDSWTIRGDVVQLGDRAFWAVIATVTASAV